MEGRGFIPAVSSQCEVIASKSVAPSGQPSGVRFWFWMISNPPASHSRSHQVDLCNAPAMNVTPSGCTAEMPPGFQPQLKGLYIATELVIAALAITGNLLVCVAVTRNRKLRTVTNYFLVSLSVADSLVGLVAIPCAVMTDLGRPRHDLPLCLLMLSILMVLTQSSVLSLLAIAAERYMAILLPFQYQRVMSPRNAALALLATWCLGAVSGSVPLIDWHRQPAGSDYCIFTCVVDMSFMVYFNFFCCLLVPLAAMLVIYSRIFLAIRHQLRRIGVAGGGGEDATAARDSSASGAAGGGKGAGMESVKQSVEMRSTRGASKTTEGERGVAMDASSGSADSSEARSKGCSRHELRKATSLFLVLALFALCWMPIHLINCVLLLCPSCQVPMSLTLGAVLLSHANSAINPILYAYRMRSFRHTLRAMWRGMWSSGREGR